VKELFSLVLVDGYVVFRRVGLAKPHRFVLQGALKTAGTPALSKKCRAFSSLGTEIQNAFGPLCPLK